RGRLLEERLGLPLLVESKNRARALNRAGRAFGLLLAFQHPRRDEVDGLVGQELLQERGEQGIVPEPVDDAVAELAKDVPLVARRGLKEAGDVGERAARLLERDPARPAPRS